MLYICLILLFIPNCLSKRVFEDKTNSWLTIHRLMRLIRAYYEEGEQRIQYINNKKFIYEHTLGYETGYVLGEVIERYRKMVEHVKNSEKFTNYHLYDLQVRCELVQRLYFEIFHLVNMIHELPRKYHREKGKRQKKSKKGKSRVKDLLDAEKNRKSKEDELAKRKKYLKKQAKKMRQIMLLQGNVTSFKRKTPKRWWDLEYGWEIDYYW